MQWRKIKLTDKQKVAIRNAEAQIKKPKLLRRLQCIKLKDKGWKHEEVAEFLNVTIVTISDWIKIYSEEGLKSLLDWKCKGRLSILTMADQDKIRARHAEKPFETAKEAKDFIQQEFGINWHLHWIQKLLKKNFDFHTRKPL
jgi:transposase